MIPTVREATPADLPALRSICLGVLPDDYQWQYCFPKTQRQDAAVEYVDRVLGQCLEPGNCDWFACVAEEPRTHKITSLAVYSLVNFADEDTSANEQVSALGVAAESTASTAGSKDIARNTTRVAALKRAITLNGNRHLSRYGDQMFLHAVITHPDHQNLGYAKLICKHLKHIATKKHLALSVVASPRGYVFYSGVGFSDCGSVSVQVPDEKDEIQLKSMILAAPAQNERRGSLLDRMGMGLNSPMQAIRRLSNAS